MRRRRLAVALPSPSKDKPPLNVAATRTHEGVVLEAGNRHGVVWNDLH
jgi:hypothetical protein